MQEKEAVAEKITKTLSEDSLCPGRDSSRKPAAYKEKGTVFHPAAVCQHTRVSVYPDLLPVAKKENLTP
jgi:hypothetical protein